VDDAAAMVRKIRGYTLSRKPAAVAPPEGVDTGNGKPAVNHSRSGKNFGYITVNFDKLLQTLITEPAYQPTIPELQVKYLQEKLANLYSVNAALVSSASELTLARATRNAFFYEGPGSLYSIAMAVKQQVRATFGNKSEATRLANKIRFTK
jgi:hypothetical protein